MSGGFPKFDNIPAIIQQRLSEGDIRQEERKQIAEWIEGLKEHQLPEIFRKSGFGDDSNDDGWVEFTLGEKAILRAIAAKLRSQP